ncbi:MAG: glutamate--tRNA ligase [Candidatus Omnitrophota bacterium]
MKSSDETIVRFAPSPTGYLHIGGARTCLFNWLYARHTKGKFILRIEDTDLARSKQEYLDEILESIKWLGMDFDEIYYQSKRFGLYRDYAQKLVDCGRAYKKDDAIFFKYDFSNVEIDDLIRGKIVFNELPKEEEVIIKKDGTPTYNFSCCIDDALMKMSLVIRGEDHISNTPKQILMYKALGFKVPQYAHVPLILSEEGGRMSKRFGATSIREYKEEGYLAEAIANYLLLLSWSPGGNREIITLVEAKDIFEIKRVNKTAASFSMDKLNWINSEYIKKKNTEEYLSLVEAYLKDKNFLPADSDKEYVQKVLLLFKDRLSKLSDLFVRARFCFYDDYTYDEDTKEILQRNLSKEINVLAEKFSALTNFNHEEVEKEFRLVAATLGLKTKELVHPVRVALSGKKVGPSLFETMEVLGKERVVAMLKRLIDYWNKGTSANG